MKFIDLVIGEKYIFRGKEVICVDKGKIAHDILEWFYVFRTLDDKQEISGRVTIGGQIIQGVKKNRLA